MRMLLITLLAAAPSAAGADPIFEDRGLYAKDSWNVAPLYDDLSDPDDGPGVLTAGSPSGDPSGPEVDFATPDGRKVLPEAAKARPGERREIEASP